MKINFLFSKTFSFYYRWMCSEGAN